MAPAWTTARRSARGISIFATANASSSAASNPVSPEIAGRMIGNGEYVGDYSVTKIEARRVELHGPEGSFWISLP